jgi:Transposase DDE domain
MFLHPTRCESSWTLSPSISAPSSCTSRWSAPISRPTESSPTTIADNDRGVFYIDNHLRPYTGKRVIRKGWRMQDKRVRPGITDYYVHDEDGRPLLRVDVPSHDSLPFWMMHIVTHLRSIVGADDRVLMAFDRGGAFPETMASLRDEGCEFVTYERAPYPKLPPTAFTSSVTFDDETIPFVDSRINLRKGRGRVRRIAVLTEDGRQVNLLASSTFPPERLIEIMRGRWRQENAFKFGKERWGINQLDARKTSPVEPDQIIPNPARRRLDIDRRAANVREGDARCLLARYDKDHPRHLRAQRDLDAALDAERSIDALRPHVPKHARVADTELAGKLVRHDGRRKLVLDTIRIACANAESDLAQMLAAYLPKPREAKHLLANIFRSPGRIRVHPATISVGLAPAATRAERRAIENLLRDLTALDLTLPGDPRIRRLVFRSQLQ